MTPVGLSAATPSASSFGPQPIYAAVSLSKAGKLTTRRCGAYRIFSATYTGRSASGDPRLAGVVTYVGRVSLTSASTSGIASGTMTVKDPRGRVRMRATVMGVVTQSSVVNGLVFGSLINPNALLRANVTIVFDDKLNNGEVRLGLESGANSAVAYPAVPKC